MDAGVLMPEMNRGVTGLLLDMAARPAPEFGLRLERSNVMGSIMCIGVADISE